MNFLETLYPRAQAANRRLVLPEGQDPRVIRAAIEIHKHRLATPIVLAWYNYKTPDFSKKK